MVKTVYLGVDTGGTFTDFVLYRDGQVSIHKVLSTPHAPAQAILQGIRELGLDDGQEQTQLIIVHGSTVATNAVLEGKGVRTAFITNRGLADMLSIGRQVRRELYNLTPDPIRPPVPRELCLETGGRLSATGEVVEALTDADLIALADSVHQLAPQAIAINLLFSYLDERFEKQIEVIFAKDYFVSRSSHILPEHKEYERGMTTWLNAYVGPLVQGYLQRLGNELPGARISIMQSSGDTLAADQAGEQAVHMLLSGPAGGLAAALYIGKQCGCEQLLTFDMGGTSTDVALLPGYLPLTNEGQIANYPVAVPMVDMHTIGAGGGSIAMVDAGGLLQVGPQSAGAEPGPACYGRGGQLATVTDANLVLGYLPANSQLGGQMPLQVAAAQAAMMTLANQLNCSVEAAAAGVRRLANEHMAQALRVMSIQRGVDPRTLTLMSFGGAGGLHVCALADALEMRKALVPNRAGVLSALGMLVAPRGRQLSRSVIGAFDAMPPEQIQAIYQDLVEQGRQAMQAEGIAMQKLEISLSLDLRYRGQSYSLNVGWQDKSASTTLFHALHEQRYGHRMQLPLELVNLRVALHVVAESMSFQMETAGVADRDADHVRVYGLEQEVPVIPRQSLSIQTEISGPAIITEAVATTWLADGWSCRVDDSGNLHLTRS